MKHLGIDYGTKKVGIALSDDGGMIASPKMILPNTTLLVEQIVQLCGEENVEVIVVGESVQLDGSPNRLMNDIEKFVSHLKKHLDLPIHFEKEWMSSVAAKSHLYSKGNIANERWSGKENKKRREAIDDNAAALILQRFLDRN